MVLLVLAIIFFPLPIFIIAINLLQSSNSSDKGPGNVMFIVGLSALILFGLLLGNSLKHYLYHQETRDDVLLARLSPFLILKVHNSESSQLSSVGSTMGSMMSGLSVFSGAGTILGPLISMAGPGIMVTVMSMIASVVMNTVLTPLFSQFNSTVLQDDLNTLMVPLGGLQNGSLALLDNIASLLSVTSQPGVTSQDSGSGYITQNTGTSVGTTGSLSLTGSSGTCNITAIGTCLASEFNDLLLLSKTLLDNSNGAFTIFNNIMGELFTVMETLTGSSSTPATSVTTAAPAIATSATTLTSTSTTGLSKAEFALHLGFLAIEKDTLGAIKTSTTNNPEISLIIQFFRIAMDASQYYQSIEFMNNYPSRSSFLWFVKSFISFSTNYVSLVNDMNNVAPQSWASSFATTLKMSNFGQASQLIKAVLQSTGAIVFIQYYLNHQSSIAFLSLPFDFIGAYVLQKALKIWLFFEKVDGSQDLGTLQNERYLYYVSIGLNTIQMLIYGL